jgi:predicted nucleic acid-binding Zn ribbon protein
MERAGRLIGKMNLPPKLADAESRARAAWPAAAGKKIARHTLAVALVRDKLVVEVGDAVWQKQLNTLRHFLLRNLARELGEPLVVEIDFRPMLKRREPQRAEVARPADAIHDPVLALLYERKRKGAE